MSKTYSVTGCRVGYAIAPPEVTNAIRKMHDFLTVGAPASLQAAQVIVLFSGRALVSKRMVWGSGQGTRQQEVIPIRTAHQRGSNRGLLPRPP